MIVYNNKTKITLASILILALFAMPVSAEYYITATMETVQNSGSGNTWTTPVSFRLNMTESKTMYGVTVNYADIGNSNTLALFRITGGTSTDAALSKNQVACIKGNCLIVNGTPENVGDIRFTLSDIIQYNPNALQNATSATSDNVVTVYIQCSTGEKLNLNRNGQNKYEPSMCNEKTGWSNSADKELNLYIHRNFNIPTSINLETDGGYTEKAMLDNGNTRPFTLTSNSKYVFAIKTTRIDAWGGEIIETGTYTITTTGLATSSAGAPSSKGVRGTFDVYLPSTKTLDMGEKVTFAPMTGVEVTPKTNNNYEFDFRQAGSYSLKFTRADGTEDTVDFNVKESASPTQQPKVTIAANQQQGGDDGGLFRYILGGGVLTGIVLIGYIYSKRKPSTPNMHANPLKKSG